ncbi:MAG: Gfo/Idh/MocA family oxidoreductase [Armatimonadetes bacterium]|nr:Gfo/Idh/MocA family oxidoreductase [Armatimonadota bacterium]
MPKKLRIAVIGCGGIAVTHHLPRYEEMADVTVIALADPDPQHLNTAGERFGVARRYANYEEMLAREEIDAVDICTPNHLHTAPVFAAVRAGCHVLCQKPIATTIEDATTMIEAARAAGVVLGIIYMQRFMKCYLTAKHLIDCGTIGRVTFLRARMGHAGGLSASVAPERWRHSFANLAGSFSLLAVHHADLMRWYAGPVKQVAAIGKTLVCSMEGDDNMACLLEFENGAVGVLESCYNERPGSNVVEVYGDLGTLVCQTDGSLRYFATSEVETMLPMGGVGGEGTEWQVLPPDRQPAISDFESYHAHWVHCLRTGRPPVTPGEEGRASLEIVVAAYESSAGGRFVALRHQRW